MRKITMLLILLGLSGVFATTAAQDGSPALEREIITVLRMGEGIFEPELWRASAAENLASTTATWQSTFESGYGGTSFLNYLHFSTGYSLDELDSFFDEDWFAETFINWEDARKTNVCFDDDLTLHEFTLVYRDNQDNLTEYALRYWVEPVSETRVRTWHVAFPSTLPDGSPSPEGQALLDDYAARMYPDLPGCR